MRFVTSSWDARQLVPRIPRRSPTVVAVAISVDLRKGAVEADAVAPADELDVAVDLVVAAADERGLGKAGDVAIDERSRSMVVDREKDDIPSRTTSPTFASSR